MAKYARFKSKEYPYFHGRVKQENGSYVRYWTDTDPSIVAKAAREKRKKAGTLPVYGETTKSLGDKLYEETLVSGKKHYYGRIGRPRKRKNPETGKMESHTKQYSTGMFESKVKAETALAALEKEHPLTIGGADSGDVLLTEHLESLPEGATINRNELQNKYYGVDDKWKVSKIGRLLKEFKNKKFKIVGTGPVLRTGETRLKFTQPERNALNERYSKEYGGLKGQKLYAAMAAAEDSSRARQTVYQVQEGEYTGKGSGSAAKDVVIKQLNKLKKLPWIRRWFKAGDFDPESVRKAAQKVGNAIKTKEVLPRGQTWLSIGARRIADLARALTGDTNYIKMKTVDKGVLAGATRVVDTTKASIFQEFGGPFKREMYNLDLQRQVGKPAGWLANIKQFITRKLRPEHQVDIVKNIASAAKAGTGGYSLFWQGIDKDIHKKKLTVDLGMEEAEFKLRNVGDNSKVYTNPKTGVTQTREQIRDAYNKKVRAFLSQANKDVKPGEPKVRALELTLDTPPSQTIGRYGEMSDIMKKNVDKAWTDHQYGFKVPKDLLFPEEIKAIVKDPSLLQKILKMGPKAPRVIGIPLAIGAGVYAGARGIQEAFKLLSGTPLQAATPDQVQLQTAGISGGTTIPKVDLVPGTVDQVSEEVIQEPGTTELEAMDFQIDQPESMAYNATEGNFVNAEGEREPQPGVLNWIAENPTKSSLAAMPLAMGAGFGLEKLSSKFGNESVARSGLGRAGSYLKGWKAFIPAMMIPHAMYEYKAGHDLPEMVTNPINALWALGIRSKGEMGAVEDYYQRMKDLAGRKGLDMTTLKGLKSVEGWKRLPKDFQTAMMSPAAKGTNLAFGTTFRKPFVATMKALNPEFAGVATTKAAQSWGKKALLRAALIPAGILAATPAGWLTAGFLGADFLWDQYKDFRDGKVRIDEMRARGQISEEEAKNYRSLILQGSIPFGIGNRMFGPDTMRIGGEDLDPTQQREVLKGMESQLDEWQAGDMERRSKFREDHFEEGGRVGFKTGGMDRRDFLKWLAALAAGATGIFKGKSKDIVKPLVVDATKTVPAKFIGVEGMPAWFPRVIAKIKAHGKLIEMADKKYIQGDIYEMVIPVKVPKFDMVGGKQKMSGFETVQKKVVMEDNPLSGEIEIRWSVDDFDGEMTRQINFKPGQAGYQKFGVDDAEAAAQGITEFQRVKVEKPEFTYGNPDQSHPERAEFEFKDIFTEGDDVVKSLEDLAGVATKETESIEKGFQKKIYKDIEGEEAIIPEPESAGVSSKGDVYGEEEFLEIIGGDIPEHLKKKAKGGVVETGNIAREPGLVPPLSGPTPQGQGIVGLFSNPKQVNVGS